MVSVLHHCKSKQQETQTNIRAGYIPGGQYMSLTAVLDMALEAGLLFSDALRAGCYV